MDFQAIVGLLALLFFSTLWIARTKPKKNTTMEAPQPPGAWPIIGHLPQLLGSEQLFRTLGAMADKYGPVFTLRFGMHRTLIVSSWEVAKECFTTNDKILANRPTSAATKYMTYDGAMFGFAGYGPYWREVRKIATIELLSNHRLESLKHVPYTEIDRGIKQVYGLWLKNESSPVKVEMNQWFGELTMNVVLKMVVGKRYFNVGDAENEEGADHGNQDFRRTIIEFFKLSGVSVASDVLPFLSWLDLQGQERAMKRTAKEMDLIAEIWLKEHREKKLSGKGKGDQDFMDVMLSILNEDAHLSAYNCNTVVKATSLTAILAATDTTSVSLSWALSLLLNNRHVLKKAQDELDINVGKDRLVDYSDIENLVYLQAIVKETLRLYPAGPLGLPHEAIEDCHIGGYHIQAGTRIIVNLWKLQRDPRVWSDPSEFQPERFLTAHKDVDFRGQSFEYIPFGSGRRMCPGISFAHRIIHITLARLIQGFELRASSDGPVDMTEGSGLTMPKVSPMEILFTPRLPPKLYE